MDKKISANYRASQWSPQLADRYSASWSTKIDIIKDRFESRFINPVSALIYHNDAAIKRNCGFVVMSIDCLLIETLNQFFLGLRKTNDKYYPGNTNPNYKWNWQAFRDFFTYSTFFPAFKADEKLTEEFFSQVRCGLLHQAESKFNSLINLKHAEMVIPIVEGDWRKGIVINRNLFHHAVKNEFEKYLSDLNDPESKNILASICGIHVIKKWPHYANKLCSHHN
ncbi:MAG TPA: hypothetical protein VF622_18750 [Segetibacter sp.]